ncbi:MAG TPA: oligosaccharide flippase family protein [Polyangiales bacterium]|nr:oligosaccharide flippase family protein [Polyangiales bacterium]
MNDRVEEPGAEPEVAPASEAATEPTPAQAEAHQPGALRKLVIRGSAFEMIGYGTGQVIRFGSNLVLSRLLFPEAFGLSALVNIMNQGLIMLSDVGLPTVIVQSPRGDEPRFLNTAFTWQAVRSLLLWICALAMAIPMAYMFAEPELKWLIPVGAMSVLFLGVRSTAYFTLRRQLRLLPLLILELVAQIGAVALMIPWAIKSPSVWTLIGGMLMTSVLTSIGSHMIKVGYRNKFEWDSESAKSMLEFGKWIAGSSMLTFASQQGDRLLLGHFLGAATLGVYSIAVFLSSALGEAITRVTTGVFFPAYSRVNNEGTGRLREVFYKTRLVTDALILPALGGLAVLGPFVVHLLYDPRYADAGWMLRVLSVRVALACMVSPLQFCLFALGHARYGFYLNLARVMTLAIGVPIGFNVSGVAGLVWAVAASEVPALIVCYFGFARAKLLSVLHELRAPAFYLTGLVLGYAVLSALEALGWSQPGRIRFH